MQKVNLTEALASFVEHWQPRAGTLNTGNVTNERTFVAVPASRMV